MSFVLCPDGGTLSSPTTITAAEFSVIFRNQSATNTIQTG